MFEIIIDGFSNSEFGLVVEHRPIIPVAKKKYQTYEIAGRDGTLTEFEGYQDREIEIEFALIYRDNLSRKIRELTSWLLNAKELRLSDDYEVYYKIKNISIDDITRYLQVLGRFKVKFTLEPFSYLSEETLTISNAITIYNQGTHISEPYLKIYGSGNITLSVGSQSVTLNSIQDYIEIDSELMQCKKGSTNTNNKMVGDFPLLQLGANAISWTGNITKLELIPRWRCL